MDFIVWMDYTSSHPEKSFGLLDEETNCYIELPAEWEGNLKPVSYTHLDVYKRQTPWTGTTRSTPRFGGIAGKPSPTAISVSYTHLDVYKRQTL